LRAKGDPAGSRASSLQQVVLARHRRLPVGGRLRAKGGPAVRAESALPQSEPSPSSAEGWLGRFASKLPPTGGSCAAPKAACWRPLAGEGWPGRSRGIRPPTVRTIAELGRRVARPVREQAPSNRRFLRGTEGCLWEAGSAGRRAAWPVREQAPSNSRAYPRAPRSPAREDEGSCPLTTDIGRDAGGIAAGAPMDGGRIRTTAGRVGVRAAA